MEKREPPLLSSPFNAPLFVSRHPIFCVAEMRKAQVYASVNACNKANCLLQYKTMEPFLSPFYVCHTDLIVKLV